MGAQKQTALLGGRAVWGGVSGKGPAVGWGGAGGCFFSELLGAGNRNRTYDLRITNAPLYQLSYSGEGGQF